MPQGFGSSGDQGLELGIGDGTVPEMSASLGNPYDIEITSNHVNLPTKAESQIYKIFNRQSSSEFTLNTPIPLRFLMAKIFSPADIVVVAPDGKKVGKDFTTGQEINEIPGAFYSGFNTDDEYVTIPDPLYGEYKIETIGTGNGGEYTLQATSITDSGVSEGSFTGVTLPDLQESVSFDVSSDTTSPLTITTDDKEPPKITITSPIQGSYEHSQTIQVIATSTDNTGVATSTVSFGGRLIANESKVDLFFEKLGTTTIVATATDFQNNQATTSLDIRVIATVSSTISDIGRAYSMGWITKKSVRDELIQGLQKVLKDQKKIDTAKEKEDDKVNTKKLENKKMIIDKNLGRALLSDLRRYNKDKINNQAYNVIKADLEWLVNN